MPGTIACRGVQYPAVACSRTSATAEAASTIARNSPARVRAAFRRGHGKPDECEWQKGQRSRRRGRPRAPGSSRPGSVSIVVWPGGSGASRSRASGCARGANPSTCAIGGLVPRPPLSATYGPTRNTRPPTRNARARHHRGQLIRVARETGKISKRRRQRQRQEHPFGTGQIRECPATDRQRQPEKPPLTQEPDGGPQPERPPEQERALREDVQDDESDDRIGDRQQAGEPRRLAAEELKRQQVDRNDQQNAARETEHKWPRAATSPACRRRPGRAPPRSTADGADGRSRASSPSRHAPRSICSA